jgi:hypothetical protein
MATDLLVWNVSKRDIRVRPVEVNAHSWPSEPPTKPDEPDPNSRTPLSQFIESGRLDLSKELTPTIEEFKKENGIK